MIHDRLKFADSSLPGCSSGCCGSQSPWWWSNFAANFIKYAIWYIYNIAILEDGQKNPCHRSWFTSWFDDRYGHSNGFYNDLSYHISYIHVFPYLFMIDNPYLLVSMIFMFFPMILPYLLANNPHLLDSTGWGPPDISWCINHDNPHELARLSTINHS